MVKNIISKYFPNRSDLNIIDLGCGTGLLMKELQKYGTVQGIDISARAISFCKDRNIQNVSIGNITNLNLPTNSFDVVLALDVLEHIEDDCRAIEQIKKIVKPKGIVIIFVPTFMFLWGITDINSMHYRRYRLSDLKKKLRDKDLIIQRSSYFNTFLFLPIAVFRLIVRFLKIKITSENKIGNPFVDSILYTIFLTESKILRFVSFPFGVSGMVICSKK